MHHLRSARFHGLASLVLGLTSLASVATSARADVGFLGVAAGDPTTSGATLWTRAFDPASPADAQPLVTAQISTDSSFGTILTTATATPVASLDYTLKFTVNGLAAGQRYYYRFSGPSGPPSIAGTFKTAPAPAMAAPVRFGFSGDMDGLIRPYALAVTLPAQQLDFYINLGDVIYENASNVKGNIGLSYTNSPSVNLSGSSASLNGVPVGGTTFATQAQLKADYEKKYRENFLPVNVGGQNSLQPLYAAQGNYTTWDNHELGNRQYINGGAPAGGSVGGPLGIDMATGRGVDARNNGTGNPLNVNDTNTSLTDYMNRSTGFLTLENVFLNYQPIADRGTVSAPADPRTHGTKQLYMAQQWGKNAIYINTDARSYRDLRLKSSDGSADETTAPRANNPARTFLGGTQLAWLKQTLLDAKNAGVTWKFVSLSDPIDQLGPIGGSLSGVTAATMQPFSGNLSYGPVNADGGKSYVGGYRAERNALLKFIADNQIVNVVFLSTDDHQNRVNELSYSPTDSENQASYVRVPRCFAIVCGPLGATGPDLFLNHDFASLKGGADLIANAQAAAGLDPIGLAPNYPGLFNVMREGDLAADTLRQPIDFYSPDSFNYNTLDISADGRILTVKTIGITSTAQNSASEYGANNNTAREILSFSIDARPEPAFTTFPDSVTVSNNTGLCSARLSFVVEATGLPVPVVTCTLNGSPISSPFEFPKGLNVVTCVASNVLGTATRSFTVTVKDTELPAVQSVTPSKTVLFPPNHKMVPITLAVAATDNCGGVTTKIVSVTSNEPVATKDEDDASPDWLITGDLSLQLRAERSGNGPGRIYTVTVEVVDQAGNKTRKNAVVTVPHDNGDRGGKQD